MKSSNSRGRVRAEDVFEIWRRLNQGEPQYLIAADFRVPSVRISEIWRGKKFAHITRNLPKPGNDND